jgi:hypothetical protein
VGEGAELTRRLAKLEPAETLLSIQGQCTALRHLVAPPEVSRAQVAQALSALPVRATPAESLRHGMAPESPKP